MPNIFVSANLFLAVSFVTAAASFVIGAAIGRRRRHRSDARSATDRMALFARYANDPILVLDPDLRIVDANERAVRTYGYTLGELQKRSLRDLRAPQTLAALVEQRPRYDDIEGAMYETTHVRQDGSQFSVEASIRAVVLNGTKVYLNIARDITNRKRSEDRLRVLEAAINVAPNSVIITDPHLVIEWVNPAFLRETGYAFEEVVGENVRTLKSAEPQHRREMALRSEVTAGRLWHGELINRRKDGSVYIENATVAPVFDASGVLSHLVGINVDVTWRLNSELEARRAAEQYRLLFEQNPQPMWIYDLETLRMQAVNDAALHKYGYTREEFLSLTVDLLHVDTGTFRQNMQAFGRTPACHFPRLRHRTKQGDIFDVEVTSHGVEWLERRARFVLANDVTERFRAEDALRQSKARFAGAFQNAPIGMGLAALDGRWLLVNRALCDLLGYTADELQQLRMENTIYPGDRSVAIAEAEQLVDDKITISQSEHRYLTKAGDLITVVQSMSLVRDDAGAPQHFVIHVLDVTEKKRFEEQVLHSQRLDSLGMLAAGIAHDLNNVLAPIVLAPSMLRTNAKQPIDIALLDTLEKAGQRGAGLVRQILAFAHRHDSEMVHIAPKHFLREIEEVVQQTFPKSVVLQTDIRPDLWKVIANPTHIHQVLLNLCVNARDAMPNGGTLTLRAENRTLDRVSEEVPPRAHGDRWVVLQVSDTGSGIPPQVLPHIWEPFFTTKPKGQGTGLGLPTVRGIVEKHGGFISVRTETAKGTTFTVHLPAVDAATEKVARLPSSARHGGNALVLVAEDDESIRRIIVQVLRSHGYSAVAAGDGNDAIALFKAWSHKVALVLTDLDMPGATGLAVAQAVHNANPAVPVLGMSGIDMPGPTPEFAPTPFALFVQKPFRPETLIHDIERTLQRSGSPLTMDSGEHRGK